MFLIFKHFQPRLKEQSILVGKDRLGKRETKEKNKEISVLSLLCEWAFLISHYNQIIKCLDIGQASPRTTPNANLSVQISNNNVSFSALQTNFRPTSLRDIFTWSITHTFISKSITHTKFINNFGANYKNVEKTSSIYIKGVCCIFSLYNFLYFSKFLFLALSFSFLDGH